MEIVFHDFKTYGIFVLKMLQAIAMINTYKFAGWGEFQMLLVK